MGGSSSKPTTGKQEVLLPPSGTIRDTTFRSVLFNQPNVEFVASPSGQMILKSQVTPELFKSYEDTLMMMARLSRLVYCDSGIICKVLLDPSFVVLDNKVANDLITKYDKEFASLRREPSTDPGAIENRPMKSYTIDFLPQQPTSQPICHYVSSPADLTFFILKGDKVPGLLPTDAVISFKGSSTVENFKHDALSQFTPVSLEAKMPAGLKMSSPVTGNTVPGAFLSHITDSWEFLDSSIKAYAPKRLFVTGHSLGGAFATLFTFILAEVKATYPFIESIHLITFGSPTLLSDVARNTFNAHLDSGNVTLDRVVASGTVTDFIPSIPVGFSHPGFQPLRTEIYPEKAGRAYHIETIKKVYQTGGAVVIGFTKAKRDYGNQTLTHVPNLVRIKTNFNPFAHAGYFGMTWLGAFRLIGMKNPGFGNHTFLSDLYPEGVRFTYKTPRVVPESAVSADAVSNTEITALASEAPKNTTEGGRRTYRKKKLRRRRTSKK